ncbi:MAG: S8 family serine peptidase [Nitrososphaerales archaeon]
MRKIDGRNVMNKYVRLSAVLLSTILLLSSMQSVAIGQTPATNQQDNIHGKFEPGLYDKLKALEKEATLKGETPRDYDIIIHVNELPVDQDLKDKKDKLGNALEQIHKAKNVAKMQVLSFVTATVPIKEIFRLAAYDEVKLITDAEIFGQLVGLEDTNLIGVQKTPIVQPYLDVSRPEVRANLVSQTGSGIKIAILDTGIHQCNTSCHTDFSGRVSNVWDYTGTGYSDSHGHGTALATIAAASGAVSGGLYKGIAPAATLLNIKISTSGSVSPSTAINAIDRAVTNGANVILLATAFSCLVSSSGYSVAVAADQAVEKGVTFVTAIGNTGTNAVSSPACAYNVITTIAVDDRNTQSQSDDILWSGNSYGPISDGIVKPDLVAPGVAIHVLKKDAVPSDPLSNQYYDTAGGTSYAAGHVAGVAALVIQAHSTWTPAQVKASLKQTADLYNLGSDENHRGKGLVDAYDAVNLATSSINYANAYAFDVPNYPSLSSYTITSGSGDSVSYKLSKETTFSKGLSANSGSLKGTTTFKRMSFPSIKISGLSQTLDDTKLYSGPRADRSGSGLAYTYVKYLLGSDEVTLQWLVGSGAIQPYAYFQASSSKTLEALQYLDFDIGSTNTNDKATLAVSPYTPYTYEQKFTVGTSFNVRDNSPLVTPWLNFNYGGDTTITEWILKWKSTEDPTNNPDSFYSSTECINCSGSGDNILAYYKGSRTATSHFSGPSISVNWTTPP